MNKLLLIDGNSLLNRAYYAFGGNRLLTHNDMPTNATYGFMNMMIRAIVDLNPSHIAVAFDVKGKTFRHEMSGEYKATRKPTPQDLVVQIRDTKELLQSMNIMTLEKQGFEADDIIGTISKAFGGEVIILTGDKDAFQLVSPTTQVHLTKTGVTNTEVYTEERLQAEFGLTPQGMIDLKALMGDQSDNIPGVKGIGEKTALKLLIQTKNSLNLTTEQREQFDISYKLATINCSVPIEFTETKATLKFPLAEEIKAPFMARGFKSLLARKNIWEGYVEPPPPIAQMSLFD